MEIQNWHCESCGADFTGTTGAAIGHESSRHAGAQTCWPTGMKIEIRTTDTDWQARHPQGRDGRHIVNVDKAERLTFAGVPMVRFHLDDLPRDFLNANVQVPAVWVVSA